MTKIAIPDAWSPFNLELGSALRLTDDELFELCSPSDRLEDVEAKMEEYRSVGVPLGWLIDPEERRVHVYRPGRPPEVLDAPDRVEADPELPDFVLDLEPIWQPA